LREIVELEEKPTLWGAGLKGRYNPQARPQQYQRAGANQYGAAGQARWS